MKKKKEVKKNCCIKSGLDSFKKQLRAKIQEAEKCAKKNPQKTKTILAGLGAIFVAIIAFLIGKNKNKKKDQD